MRRAVTALALVTLSRVAFAQPPQSAPRFDAADINLRARTGTTNQPTMTGGVLRGGDAEAPDEGAGDRLDPGETVGQLAGHAHGAGAVR